MKIAVDIGTSFFGGSHFLGQKNLTGVGLLTSIFLSNAVMIAGIVFVFLVILGGYKMISGAGGQNPAVFKQGQEIITAAVIGLILVMVSYWIVGLLQESLGVSIIG